MELPRLADERLIYAGSTCRTQTVVAKKAEAFFASLAPSYQRQFIGWIVTAKRKKTKERRLDESMELLGRGEKLGMR